MIIWVYLNPSSIRGIRGYGFCNQCRSKAWKNLLFESVFQLWCLFDTPKNRVVTSDVIWLLSQASPAVQVIGSH
jgi:hypothetical protein